MNMHTRIAITALAAAATAVPALGQTYKIDNSVISSGGAVVTSTNYQISMTVGQPVAGFVKNTSFLHWIGFWASEVPTPRVVSNISDAKKLRDGTMISVAGKLSVSGTDPSTQLTDRFNGFLYIQEPNRANGIRVECSAWPVANLFRGSTVNVMGTLGTTPAGERQITGAIVIVGTTATPPLPLGVNNSRVSSTTGLANTGLLIRTWGKIIESGTGYLMIDDGSGTPVRVDTTGLANVPTKGYISVAGPASLYAPGKPMVLPRADSDIK